MKETKFWKKERKTEKASFLNVLQIIFCIYSSAAIKPDWYFHDFSTPILIRVLYHQPF